MSLDSSRSSVFVDGGWSQNETKLEAVGFPSSWPRNKNCLDLRCSWLFTMIQCENPLCTLWPRTLTTPGPHSCLISQPIPASWNKEALQVRACCWNSIIFVWPHVGLFKASLDSCFLPCFWYIMMMPMPKLQSYSPEIDLPSSIPASCSRCRFLLCKPKFAVLWTCVKNPAQDAQ